MKKVKVGSSKERQLHEKQSRMGVDAVLSTLSKNKSISLLDKSQLDWTRSKDQHGDADELEQYTKNGYVLYHRQALICSWSQTLLCPVS